MIADLLSDPSDEIVSLMREDELTDLISDGELVVQLTSQSLLLSARGMSASFQGHKAKPVTYSVPDVPTVNATAQAQLHVVWTAWRSGTHFLLLPSILDRAWYLSEHPTAEIYHTQEPVTVRRIGSARHASSEYVKADIFLEGEAAGTPAMIKISRDVHLVEKLGTKMLIGMDILGPEGAVVDLPAERLRLGKDVACPLTIKSLGKRQERIVQAAERTIIKPFEIANVPIKYRKALPKGCDYLFEPRTLPVNLDSDGGVVAHVVDAEVFMVQVRYASSFPVTIPRQMKFGRILEYEEEGCFLATPSEAPLAVRPSWKKIAATAALAAIGEMKASVLEHAMANGVTIYQPGQVPHQVGATQKVVEAYPSVFRDSGGVVDMPEEEWMPIKTLPNVKPESAKVYPVGQEDRSNLINQW